MVYICECNSGMEGRRRRWSKGKIDNKKYLCEK